jgi:hypothetical protein
VSCGKCCEEFMAVNYYCSTINDGQTLKRILKAFLWQIGQKVMTVNCYCNKINNEQTLKTILKAFVWQNV